MLSPTLFNVLVNQLASAGYPPGVRPVIYADDILLQSTSVPAMQRALTRLEGTCTQLGLVINESKTKYQCRQRRDAALLLHGVPLDRVREYKYLGVYVGYTRSSKDSQLRHVLTQCQARLQPLKALARAGEGVGVPVLRTMYIATIRSVIDYAAPVLAVAGRGRLHKLDLLQNAANRIILGCQKNAMVESMRLELNLPTVQDRVHALNAKNFLKLIRDGLGSDILEQLSGGRAGQPEAIRVFRDHQSLYALSPYCTPLAAPVARCAPWASPNLNIVVLELKQRKCMYSRDALRTKFSDLLATLPTRDAVHIYCDGSVADDGRAGCAAVLLVFDSAGLVTEHRHSARISDHVSSTHAELQAVALGLSSAPGCQHTYVILDSRSAIHSLNSQVAIHAPLVSVCRSKIDRLEGSGFVVQVLWIPSHIGIPHNERADLLAKQASKNDTVALPCSPSLNQLKAVIRGRQLAAANSTRLALQEESPTFRHYVQVYNETHFSYGAACNVLADTVTMRLRLGYKYYWEYGGPSAGCATDRQCRVCGADGGHSLSHYVLACPPIAPFRNPDIHTVSDQIIWWLNNGKVPDIVATYRTFAPRR